MESALDWKACPRAVIVQAQDRFSESPLFELIPHHHKDVRCTRFGKERSTFIRVHQEMFADSAPKQNSWSEIGAWDIRTGRAPGCWVFWNAMNEVAKKILREKVAIHEAAHAVAFVHSGLTEYMGDLRVDVPHVLPSESEFPKEGMVLGHLELAKEQMFPDGTTDPVELQTIEGLCLSYLVAKPAEMKYLRDTFRNVLRRAVCAVPLAWG